jgi:predicted transporter
MLYDEIGSIYREDGDWDSGGQYHALAAEYFYEAGDYEDSASSYALAGDCDYEQNEFTGASECYQQAQAAAEIHQRANPGYDTSWIAEKLTESQASEEKAGLMTHLLMVGVILMVAKYAAKASLGSAYSPMGMKKIVIIASVYLAIGVIAGVVIDRIGAAVLSDKISATIFDFGVMFGAFQIALAALLIVLGFQTINKWKQGKDMSGKTFLAMVIPCPVSVSTMLISSSFLAMAGMGAMQAGLFVGGGFFAAIIGISLLLRRFKPRQTPAILGMIMVFFALIYIVTLLFAPAYLEAAGMNIETAFNMGDTLPAVLSIGVIIAVGFIWSRMSAGETISKTKGG